VRRYQCYLMSSSEPRCLVTPQPRDSRNYVCFPILCARLYDEPAVSRVLSRWQTAQSKVILDERCSDLGFTRRGCHVQRYSM
jgi:hypothetical protein